MKLSIEHKIIIGFATLAVALPIGKALITSAAPTVKALIPADRIVEVPNPFSVLDPELEPIKVNCTKKLIFDQEDNVWVSPDDAKYGTFGRAMGKALIEDACK